MLIVGNDVCISGMPPVLTSAPLSLPGCIDDGVPPDMSLAGTEDCRPVVVVWEPELVVVVSGALDAIASL